MAPSRAAGPVRVSRKPVEAPPRARSSAWRGSRRHRPWRSRLNPWPPSRSRSPNPNRSRRHPTSLQARRGIFRRMVDAFRGPDPRSAARRRRSGQRNARRDRLQVSPLGRARDDLPSRPGSERSGRGRRADPPRRRVRSTTRGEVRRRRRRPTSRRSSNPSRPSHPQASATPRSKPEANLTATHARHPDALAPGRAVRRTRERDDPADPPEHDTAEPHGIFPTAPRRPRSDARPGALSQSLPDARGPDARPPDRTGRRTPRSRRSPRETEPAAAPADPMLARDAEPAGAPADQPTPRVPPRRRSPAAPTPATAPTAPTLARHTEPRRPADAGGGHRPRTLARSADPAAGARPPPTLARHAEPAAAPTGQPSPTPAGAPPSPTLARSADPPATPARPTLARHTAPTDQPSPAPHRHTREPDACPPRGPRAGTHPRNRRSPATPRPPSQPTSAPPEDTPEPDAWLATPTRPAHPRSRRSPATPNRPSAPHRPVDPGRPPTPRSARPGAARCGALPSRAHPRLPPEPGTVRHRAVRWGPAVGRAAGSPGPRARRSRVRPPRSSPPAEAPARPHLRLDHAARRPTPRTGDRPPPAAAT